MVIKKKVYCETKQIAFVFKQNNSRNKNKTSVSELSKKTGTRLYTYLR